MGPPGKVATGSTCPQECRLSPSVRGGGGRNRVRAWGSHMFSAPTELVSDHAGSAREAARTTYAATKKVYQLVSVRVRLCALRPSEAGTCARNYEPSTTIHACHTGTDIPRLQVPPAGSWIIVYTLLQLK